MATPGRFKQGDEFGEYTILHELGRGGMGIAYRALQRSLRRTVVIKVALIDRLGPNSTARFSREIATQVSLTHPNLVHVLDGGVIDQLPYLVLQYMPGGDLAQAVRSRGPLAIGECHQILFQIANALVYLHDHGVIHRDLKPENILFGEDSRACVSDFGLAYVVSREGTRLTAASDVVGTPTFLSPEAFIGSEPTPALDIWALGVLAYFLLLGRLPFRGESVAEVARSICEDIPAPLEPDRVGDVTGWNDLVSKLLSKRPEKRPTSKQVVEMLQSLGRSYPEVSPPRAESPSAEFQSDEARRFPGEEGRPTAVLPSVVEGDRSDAVNEISGVVPEGSSPIRFASLVLACVIGLALIGFLGSLPESHRSGSNRVGALSPSTRASPEVIGEFHAAVGDLRTRVEASQKILAKSKVEVGPVPALILRDKQAAQRGLFGLLAGLSDLLVQTAVLDPLDPVWSDLEAVAFSICLMLQDFLQFEPLGSLKLPLGRVHGWDPPTDGSAYCRAVRVSVRESFRTVTSSGMSTHDRMFAGALKVVGILERHLLVHADDRVARFWVLRKLVEARRHRDWGSPARNTLEGDEHASTGRPEASTLIERCLEHTGRLVNLTFSSKALSGDERQVLACVIQWLVKAVSADPCKAGARSSTVRVLSEISRRPGGRALIEEELTSEPTLLKLVLHTGGTASSSVESMALIPSPVDLAVRIDACKATMKKVEIPNDLVTARRFQDTEAVRQCLFSLLAGLAKLLENVDETALRGVDWLRLEEVAHDLSRLLGDFLSLEPLGFLSVPVRSIECWSPAVGVDPFARAATTAIRGSFSNLNIIGSRFREQRVAVLLEAVSILERHLESLPRDREARLWVVRRVSSSYEILKRDAVLDGLARIRTKDRSTWMRRQELARRAMFHLSEYLETTGPSQPQLPGEQEAIADSVAWMGWHLSKPAVTVDEFKTIDGFLSDLRNHHRASAQVTSILDADAHLRRKILKRARVLGIGNVKCLQASRVPKSKNH